MSQAAKQAALVVPVSSPAAGMQTAPFLVWPVSRREFYTAISVALLPALIWGNMVYGFHASAVIGGTVMGASLTHRLLKRFTLRGQSLLYAHTLCSALMLAALVHPMVSSAVMLIAGAVLTLLLWVFKGPGRDRVHPSEILAVVILLGVVPALHGFDLSFRYDDALLARDRIVLGDLTNVAAARSLDGWPVSADLSGSDALRTINVEGEMLTLLRATQAARSTSDLRDSLRDALGHRLPPIENVIAGLQATFIGTGSALTLTLGGLYLAYRNILRPKSVATYLTAVIAGLICFSFFGAGGFTMLRKSEVFALTAYQFFGSDAVFAAVMVLALPGSEPITPGGRRVFLLFAGFLAPLVQRIGLPIPVCTAVLLVFQPLAPVFDYIFERRSWLNGD